jgi:hypothetical protein
LDPFLHWFWKMDFGYPKCDLLLKKHQACTDVMQLCVCEPNWGMILQAVNVHSWLDTRNVVQYVCHVILQCYKKI